MSLQRFCIPLAGIAFAVAAVSAGADEYEKLPLEKPARSFAVSEEGRFLLATHEEDNFVTAWTIDPLKQVAKIDCPAPRFVISRGDHSFVASYAEGTVHVISHKTWKITKSIDVGRQRVAYLTAPQHEHFRSSLLAVCGRDRSGEFDVVSINVETGRSRELLARKYGSVATLNFSGDKLITQSLGYASSGGVGDVYEVDLASGEPPKGVQVRSERRQAPLLAQVRPGLHWFGRSTLHIGMPPRSVGARLAELVVPDLNREVVYLLDEGKMRCCALDMKLTEVGQVTLSTPPFTLSYGRMDNISKRAHDWMRDKHYVPVRPIAFTRGEELFFCAMDVSKGELFRAKLPAFDVPEQVLAAAAKYSAHSRDFPAKIPAGKALDFPLFGHDVRGEYTVASNTKGYTVDAMGRMRWTPSEDDIGLHKFTVTIDRSSRDRFELQVTTEVVEPALLPAALGGSGELIEFAPLPLGQPVTAVALTEDRRHVLIAHQEDDSITVWDIAEAKVAAKIDTPSPVHILARREKCYVANGGKGTINVFSRKEGWKLVNQLTTGCGNLSYISAPQGEFFAGKIFATGKSDASIVDEKTDKHKLLPRKYPMSFCTAAFDGKHYIRQELYGVLKSVHTMTEDVWSKSSSGSSGHASMLRQARRGTVWFSDRKIYRGTIPGISSVAADRFIIPDSERPVYYRFGTDTMYCTALDEAAADVGTRRFLYPEVIHPQTRLRRTHNEIRTRGAHHHLACTLGDDLHLFIVDSERKEVYHAKTAAFQINPVVTAAAELASGNGQTFPATAAVGAKQEHLLLGKKLAADYEVVTGPPGVSVSPEGLVTWTPAHDDRGDAQIKVRASSGDQVVFLRLNTKVVGDTPVKPPVDPIAADSPGVHVLEKTQLKLSYGHDGTSILVLQGDLLMVLDAAGVNVKKRLKSKKSYSAIAARADYYVALAADSVDILAKETLEVQKTVSFKGSSVYGLALHPAKPLCYVTVRQRSAPNSAKSYQVAEIDEGAATATVLSRVYGTVIAADPRGRYLYTSVSRRKVATRMLDDKVVTTQVTVVSLVCYSLGEGGKDVHYLRATSDTHSAVRPVFASDGEDVTFIQSHPVDRTSSQHTLPASIKKEHGVKWDSTWDRLTYHPTLELIAAVSEADVSVLDRRTREPESDLLELPAVDRFVSVRELMFAPSGTHLLIAHYDSKQRKVTLRSLPLKLSDRQLAATAGGYQRPPLAQIGELEPSPSELASRAYSPKLVEALTGAAGPEVSVEEIVRHNSGAVVTVQGETRSTTGSIVGKSGYVLTDASALPVFGDVIVHYQSRRGDTTETRQARAVVVRVDEASQLALLKFEAATALNHVSLAAPDEAVAAEDIAVLSFSQTSDGELLQKVEHGYVRNVSHFVDNRPYLQTSLKPGILVPGAPIFNTRGRVVGIVAAGQSTDRFAQGIAMESVSSFLSADKALTAQTPTLRNWTDRTGKFKTEAEFISLEDDVVHLKKRNGSIIRVPLARLSDADQQAARQLSHDQE